MVVCIPLPRFSKIDKDRDPGVQQALQRTTSLGFIGCAGMFTGKQVPRNNPVGIGDGNRLGCHCFFLLHIQT